ncbi:MAG: ATP-dependent 6-phosphofructokinase [Elusimicrobiaceae bacterium]|nr:ATP-dependent 6-phosphofructokinase [Elusimicrobiaceae bacterium]
MAKKIGVLTGGGDCPGLNPAIRGAVLTAIGLGYECVGFKDGWKGLIEGNTMPLDRAAVRDIISVGGTCLGTSRTNPYKREGGVEAARETFDRLGLHALIAMGGEDTLGVANNLYNDFKFPVVGVPKTMDNDLSGTEYTFGFNTSVAVAVDALERLRDTARSHHRAIVLEVMGRHAGWVALFTAIAGAADYLCVPEKTVDVDDMMKRVKAAYAEKGYALIVASEAIDLPTTEAGQVQTLDDFGHVVLKDRAVGEKLSSLIEKTTKIECRHAVIGHIQRGGSPVLFDRILGTRVGIGAMEFVHEGKFGVMAGLCADRIVPVPLQTAVGQLKTVPQQWLDLARKMF